MILDLAERKPHLLFKTDAQVAAGGIVRGEDVGKGWE